MTASPFNLTMTIKKFLVFIFLSQFLFCPQFYASPEIKTPPFSARDINGKVHSLANYSGKYLVLYFWATWCPACRGEVENVKKAYSLHGPRGVKFLSVSLDSDRGRLEGFIEKKHIPYPILFDGRGWEGRLAADYGVASTPAYVVIGPGGAILTTGNWASDLLEFLDKIPSA